jgi:hypothetical protein
LDTVSTAILLSPPHCPPTPHSPFAISIPLISTIIYPHSLSSPISSGTETPAHNYEDSEAECSILQRLLLPTIFKDQHHLLVWFDDLRCCSHLQFHSQAWVYGGAAGSISTAYCCSGPVRRTESLLERAGPGMIWTAEETFVVIL